MKVALMLTGLARKVQEGYIKYWKHIIDTNDVDLYLHCWDTKPDDTTNQEDSDAVLDVYTNPKYFLVEKPFKFTDYREGIELTRNQKSKPYPDFDVYGSFRCLPMFYSWESTYKHIKNSGVNYDCIIRSRYDLAGSNIDLSKLDLTKVNMASNHWRGSNIYDDNLCITNQENADKIFSNIFSNVVDYHKKLGNMDIPEQNFTNYLKRQELLDKCIKNKLLDFHLLRDKKVWF